MIRGIGTDILHIPRMEQAMQRGRFAARVFTAREIAYIHRGNTPNYASAAACFCAKEAVSKALGTGMRGFGFTDIEILHDALGAPYALLHQGAKDRAGNGNILLSLSHEKDYALAFAVWAVQEDIL